MTAPPGGAEAPAALDDKDLVSRAADRDMEAFAELMRRHQNAIHALAWRLTGNREDARDLAQEAFLRAWNSLGGFRGDAAFGTWMHRIVVNLSRNLHRDRTRKGRDREVAAGNPFDEDAPMREAVSGPAASPAGHAEAGELREALEQCLGGLTPEYREAFALRVHGDMDYAAIAEALDCPVGTVKSRISEARRRLALCLQRHGVLEGDRI
jgi:RNA polymerase sigma-70 factor (ECF subfamily)